MAGNAELMYHARQTKCLIWEATEKSRVIVDCDASVKEGWLVRYPLADNKQFMALTDAIDGKTVIQPVNCVMNKDYLRQNNGNVFKDSTWVLKQGLDFGISYV